MTDRVIVDDVEDDFEKMADTFFETYPPNVPTVLRPKAKIDLVEMLRAVYQAGVDDNVLAQARLEKLRREGKATDGDPS